MGDRGLGFNHIVIVVSGAPVGLEGRAGLPGETGTGETGCEAGSLTGARPRVYADSRCPSS
jgi:hypothetical protein